MSHYIIRLTFIAFLFITGATAQTPRRAAKDSPARWYEFTSPDKDFTVEFPARPTRESDIEAASGTMRNYTFDTASESFLLSFIDTDLDPSSRERNRLPLTFRQSQVDHARERGWTIVRAAMLRRNVYQEERWTPMRHDPERKLHFVARNIARYGRQYILTCASLVPDRKVDAARCVRFLDSFRVVREPQPQ